MMPPVTVACPGGVPESVCIRGECFVRCVATTACGFEAPSQAYHFRNCDCPALESMCPGADRRERVVAMFEKHPCRLPVLRQHRQVAQTGCPRCRVTASSGS